MSRKTFPLVAFIVMAVFIGTMLFGGAVLAADKKVYRWKIQSLFPRGDVSTDNLTHFVESAAKRSNGRLKISVFAAGEIVGGKQLFEATKRGTLQMLHGAPPAWSGLVPVGGVEFGLPYQWIVPQEKTFEGKAEAIRKFFLESGFADLLREEYGKHNLYWLDIHTYGPVPFFLSKKPIVTCDDMQGLKIRDGGIWVIWHNMLGARGVDMPGSEAYMGLKLGTIDAVNWDVGAVTSLKWHEVAPYWVRGEENEHSFGHIMVNMDAWKSLPDDLKNALKGAAKDYWDILIKIYGDELKICENLVEKGELKMTRLDEACMNRHLEEAQKLWDERAGKDAVTAKAINMVKKWRGIK